MEKVESSKGAINASLLYLYQAYRDKGMSDEEAKNEVGKYVLGALKQMHTLEDFKIIEMNNTKINLLKHIQTHIQMLVDSKQKHVTQMGEALASYLSEFLK